LNRFKHSRGHHKVEIHNSQSEIGATRMELFLHSHNLTHHTLQQHTLHPATEHNAPVVIDNLRALPVVY
jgi:hypothetical protein